MCFVAKSSQCLSFLGEILRGTVEELTGGVCAKVCW